LEMQKLQAEIAKLQSEAQENQAQGGLDVAKTQSEMAKAKQLKSQADITDLNFVEQESGVTQSRDLQKQGAQARANMQLKQEEARLKDRNTLLSALTKPQPQASTRS